MTEPERIAHLADEATGALAAARSSLRHAADLTDDLDRALRRTADDVNELQVYAARLRQADEPGPHLSNAAAVAEQADDRLRACQRTLDEITDHLDGATRTLAVGRQIVDELDQLPAARQTAADLRDRIDTLRPAVRQGQEGVDDVRGRLARSRGTLEPLVYSSGTTQDRDRGAAVIDGAAAEVDRTVWAARRHLSESRETLDRADPAVAVAAQQSADLATAMRAAMNPTPAASRPASATPAEMDLRRRLGGTAKDSDRDRSR